MSKPTTDDFENSERIIQEAMRSKPLNEDATYITLYHELKNLKTFAPLLKAVNLEVLDIRAEGKIPELDELSALQKLRTICLESKVSVKSLSALERFPALRNLEIGKIYPLLDGLKLKLDRLQVASTTIDRVDYFRNMEIKWLELGNSVIYTNINDETDFEPVKGINQLWILSRSLTTLKKLGVLENIRSLWIPASRKLKNIEGVEEMKKLEAFSCYRTNIKSLAPISGLPIKFLSCGETRIKTLKKVDMSSMIQLAVNKTPLKVFDAEPMPDLEYLSLESSQLERVDEICHFPTIKHLNILNCQNLKEFGQLCHLEKLEILDLQGDQLTIENLEELLEIPALKVVNIDSTPAAKDSGIEKLKESAKERGIEIFVKEHEYSAFMRKRDQRWLALYYYMNCFKGEGNPWYRMSDKGYRV